MLHHLQRTLKGPWTSDGMTLPQTNPSVSPDRARAMLGRDNHVSSAILKVQNWRSGLVLTELTNRSTRALQNDIALREAWKGH
jgi:hypothetical protein